MIELRIDQFRSVKGTLTDEKGFFKYIAPLFLNGLDSLDSFNEKIIFDDGHEIEVYVQGSKEEKWFYIIEKGDIQHIVYADDAIDAVRKLFVNEAKRSEYSRQFVEEVKSDHSEE